MKKKLPIRISSIVGRLTRGASFLQSKQGEYRKFYDETQQQVEKDFRELSEEEFRLKYSNQIW